jgi:threonine/homoserine/homoserine lactone efflux protein
MGNRRHKPEIIVDERQSTYWVGLRMFTYGGLSFLSALASLVPITRVGAGLIIFGYLLYMLIDTYKEFYENNPRYNSMGKRNKNQHLLYKAFLTNGVDYVLFFLSVFAGIYIIFGG